MATPRHLLVDPENECDYHLVSRCVRRAFLCGVDEFTKRNCSHRRQWLVERLKQLAPCFAVDVYAYTVLSNHFHLVLRHDPLAGRAWSDEEVAWRWFEAFPPTEHGEVVQDLKPGRRELMLGDPDRVARARRTLGSMSDFMKHLKQPIARRANLEDDCTGHFFDQRFYSGALLTEEALIAAMAYVDLNPVRADLAKRIEEIRETSICDRLRENSADALADYLQPVLCGLDSHVADATGSRPLAAGEPLAAGRTGTPAPDDVESASGQPERAPAAVAPEEPCIVRSGQPDEGCLEATEGDVLEAAVEDDLAPRRPRARPAMALADYIGLVRALAEAEAAPETRSPNRVRRWLARTKVLRKRQRAYGTEPALRSWISDRGMQLRETPLPA